MNASPLHQRTQHHKMDHYSHRPPTGGSSGGGHLARYRSAPGSLLASIAESVIAEASSIPGIPGGGGEFPFTAAAPAVSNGMIMGRFLSGGEPPCMTSESTAGAFVDPYRGGVVMQQQRSYGEIGDLAAAGDQNGGGGGGNNLVRHSSSPAGFFSHLLVDDGLPMTRGIGQYPMATNGVNVMANRRLKSQLSFSRQDTLSEISEGNMLDMGDGIWGNGSEDTAGNVKHSYMSSDFPIGSWDETSSIICSAPPSKRAKDNNRDIATSLSCIDSQFSLPSTSREMATVEKFLQIQQDSVPFKIRAKRGCATHPRSIAERDRRTRISEKLRKLQELVPNMDKQTCTSDMLDLAVQHIKELQCQVQVLNQEKASCTCPSKKEIS